MNSDIALLARGLRRNLAAGLRLALFLPVGRYAFRVAPGDFALLCAFNLLAWLLGGLLRVGLPGHVDFDALPGALAEVSVLLLVATCIAYWYRKREIVLALALMLIAPAALFEAASVLLVSGLRGLSAQQLPQWQLGLSGAFLAWQLAVALRALWVAAGPRRAALPASAALLVATLLAMTYALPRSELWQPADFPDANQASIAQEELFHAQDGMLDAHLAALQPQRPGVVDLYFVGFAPDGTEDVFAKDLQMAARLMQERFDARGRALLLANHGSTLQGLPIASASNLRAALERLGAIMDPDEDILFLYVTTHGAEDGELTVDLPPLALHQIRPSALARMLHASGIKWKVLVISACYSGNFLEPLRDENTLVITATDAYNASFGCGNGQDLTWFGKAYFDRALRRTESFTDAFEFARKEVAAREREHGFAPSKPQIFQGAALSAQLARLQSRLEGGR